MTNQEATDLQEKIMDFCRDLQRQNPGWMFARAYSEAQRLHPEWFQDTNVAQDAINDAQMEMARQKEQIALSVAAGEKTEVNPEHVSEMVELANQALKQRIKDKVAEIQAEKPGTTSFQDAYARAKMRHPGLFLPDDAADKAEEDGLDPHLLLPGDKRAALAQKIMDNNPGTTFGDALDHIRRTRPEMVPDVPAELARLRESMSYA